MKVKVVAPTQRAAGFSIIELMVGIVIALIGSLVIFQTFAVSEGYKRTTISGGDAQQNGAFSLYTLERELRSAGSGLADLYSMNCNWVGADSTGQMTNLPLTPAQWGPAVITDGGANPDTLSVNYASSDGVPLSTKLDADYPGDGSAVKVKSRFGFREGDLFLVFDPADAAKPCMLRQVADLPSAAGSEQLIVHDGTPYVDLTSNPATPKFNSGPANTLYTAAVTSVLNLGSQPFGHVYSIANGRLVVSDIRNPGNVSILAEDVIDLKAHYGRDTNNDGIIDIWDKNTAAASADWSKVRAIRLAVVARSVLREKEVVTNASTLTLWTSPAGSAASPTHSVSSSDQYYRHKVYETIVPLRNVIWNP